MISTDVDRFHKVRSSLSPTPAPNTARVRERAARIEHQSEHDSDGLHASDYAFTPA
ncbi:transcriptional regulator, LysR family [Comamonas thiooxydans]|nr:transcriptional regulator, LysR family [Comamonas thiooxydans]